MHTPLGAITGLIPLTAALLSATTGIFTYILMDGSGSPTLIKIVAVSFLLISQIAFATIPRKLTKPLQQSCGQN
ncbi:hypothetical protein K1X45_00590 [Pseudochrobactrum sp. Wa41.01b-1]|uniref:hypothetical protein n=1 Tax=Pseudochrobactrum sp. Wa41.01b-1 TaxID=2864102 RepID=UPI001C687BF5|nr:hypothetical protein [Pseudochrobactrum sp. Wa41.01b-1]QYM72998.1 hypothetical protein K1X45_00590 [Pseudochrobactrum sp. Wa41.01b-1]